MTILAIVALSVWAAASIAIASAELAGGETGWRPRWYKVLAASVEAPFVALAFVVIL